MGTKTYVEHRDGGYWVTGTRVSLDSLVYAFQEGQTAKSLAQSFPVLTLEQVYGAIAYYLANRDGIDAYLMEHKRQRLRSSRRILANGIQCSIRSSRMPDDNARQQKHDPTFSGGR